MSSIINKKNFSIFLVSVITAFLAYLSLCLIMSKNIGYNKVRTLERIILVVYILICIANLISYIITVVLCQEKLYDDMFEWNNDNTCKINFFNEVLFYLNFVVGFIIFFIYLTLRVATNNLVNVR